MNKELYFLRSSEQKIVTDMSKLAFPHAKENLDIYHTFYGLTPKDLGLYALVENELAGAIWSRRFNQDHNASGFIDEDTPVMSIAVVEKFKNKDIDSFMMEQFLQEAAALYGQISIEISHMPESLEFFEKFGFEKHSDFVLLKKLEKKEVYRPSDGYDPTRWMD